MFWYLGIFWYLLSSANMSVVAEMTAHDADMVQCSVVHMRNEYWIRQQNEYARKYSKIQEDLLQLSEYWWSYTNRVADAYSKEKYKKMSTLLDVLGGISDTEAMALGESEAYEVALDEATRQTVMTQYLFFGLHRCDRFAGSEIAQLTDLICHEVPGYLYCVALRRIRAGL